MLSEGFLALKLAGFPKLPYKSATFLAWSSSYQLVKLASFSFNIPIY